MASARTTREVCDSPCVQRRAAMHTRGTRVAESEVAPPAMQSTSKRQIRAGRPTPKPSAPSPPPRRPAPPRLTPVELIERIVSLQLRQAPLDLFASETLPSAL